MLTSAISFCILIDETMEIDYETFNVFGYWSFTITIGDVVSLYCSISDDALWGLGIHGSFVNDCILCSWQRIL